MNAVLANIYQYRYIYHKSCNAIISLNHSDFNIREQFQGFEKDEDLVSYFNQVLERRDRLDILEQDDNDFYY